MAAIVMAAIVMSKKLQMVRDVKMDDIMLRKKFIVFFFTKSNMKLSMHYIRFVKSNGW